MRALALSLLLALAAAGTGWAYTYQGNTSPGNGGRPHHPSLPVAWRINDQTSDALANVTAGSDPRQALRDAFAEWESESGFSSAEGALSTIDDVLNDGVNLMTFADTPTNRDRVGGVNCGTIGPLAVTILRWNGSNQITDADILFNPCRTWSTTGVADTFPVSSVAVHEVGHFLGLDHSVVGGATLYPFADRYGTSSGSAESPASISGDDRAGANGLYGDAGFLAKTGSIEGLVTRSGLPLYGAHVVATRLADGIVFAADITRGSNLTGQNGRYSLEGLPPGDYRLHAEPADGPTTHGNWGPKSMSNNFWYDTVFPTDWRTSFLGGNASPSTVSVAAGATTTPAALVVTSGTGAINPDLIGLSNGANLPRSGIPITVAPGTSRRVVAEDTRDGLTIATLTSLTCSDPAITISGIATPIGSNPSLFWFDVTIPAGVVPGPRSLIFTTSTETALLTGFLDVSGPSSETDCSNGIDDDGDGCADCLDSDCAEDLGCTDQCPSDPFKLAPGVCGCGTPDVDGDGDGVEDCIDPCPLDNPDDSDGDSVCDSDDLCPGFDDAVDSDADGTPDGCDGCPLDPVKTSAGACGCGVPDTDLDGDTVPDCCVAGDVFPDGAGDDTVDLRDWALAVFKTVAQSVAIVEQDLSCGDVGPAQSTCLPSSGPRRVCPNGDGAFTKTDADIIRRIAAGTQAVSCDPCLSDRHVPGGALRRVGDVAPRASGGNGLTDVSDILLILNWVVGNQDPPLVGDEEFLRADVTPFTLAGGLRIVVGNSALDVSDVLALLRHVVGLDLLVWPKIEVSVRATESPTAFIGFQVTLSGWDEFAENWTLAAASAACGLDGGLDLIDDTVVVSCLGGETDGNQSLFDLSYRAPESSVAPTIEVSLIEADFDLKDGTAVLD